MATPKDEKPAGGERPLETFFTDAQPNDHTHDSRFSAREVAEIVRRDRNEAS